MELKIRKPNDFHHHLRDGEMLKTTVKHCFKKFQNVIVMPNLKPPIFTIKQALDYRKRIIKTMNKIGLLNGNPLMTLYMSKNLIIEELKDLKNHQTISGIKYYPKNATTNSSNGIKNIMEIFHVLKIMEEENIPLLIHGESIKPNTDIFKKEQIFIEEELKTIIKKFPNLRIVLEHISTKMAVEFVKSHQNVFATITPHHLTYDRNAIFDGGIHPNLYCLPILKKRKDKIALVKVATSGHKKFFLGTDNAPHKKENKLSKCGCAGIFNSPVAIEIVTEIFENANSLNKLEKFISTNGCDFYGLSHNNEFITLKKIEWQVPYIIDNLTPLCSGEKLKWKIIK